MTLPIIARCLIVLIIFVVLPVMGMKAETERIDLNVSAEQVGDVVSQEATPPEQHNSPDVPTSPCKMVFEVVNSGVKRPTFVKHRRRNKESSLVARARKILENNGRLDAETIRFRSPFFRTQENHLIKLYHEAVVEVLQREREREKAIVSEKGKAEQQSREGWKEDEKSSEGEEEAEQEEEEEEEEAESSGAREHALHQLFLAKVAKYEKHIANVKGRERLRRLYKMDLTPEEFGKMKEEYLGSVATTVDRKEASRIKSRKTKLRKKLESNSSDPKALSRMKEYNLTMNDLKRQKLPTRGRMAASFRGGRGRMPHRRIEMGQTSQQDRLRDIDLNRPAEEDASDNANVVAQGEPSNVHNPSQYTTTLGSGQRMKA